MHIDMDKQACLRKRATVLKYEDGIATLRVHTNNDGCQNCSGGKQSNCALYTFGAIFSRHRDIRQVPTKRLLESGEQVQLRIQSDVLLKIAASCYGLPIAMLIGSTTLAHLLWSVEWLTILIGLGSLATSYLLIKRWFSSIHLPDIQLTQ